jgi:hypothetical protein
VQGVLRVAAALAYVLFVLAPMWWTPHPGGPGEPGFHGLTTVAANCFLIAGLAFLAYMALIVWRARALTQPPLQQPDHHLRHDPEDFDVPEPAKVFGIMKIRAASL